MKKILTVSIMAVMAVTAANAEIASKAYVDQEIGSTAEWKLQNETKNPDVATAIARAVAGGTAANVAWSGVTDTPTTLEGYGITDAVESNTAITAGTATKITYDEKGLVTAGATLSASDIPDLTLAKITDSGALAAKNKVEAGDIDAGAIVNADISATAAIDMSKIAMPTTIANGSTEAWGTYSLTADVGQNGITYKWELIQRAQ